MSHKKIKTLAEKLLDRKIPDKKSSTWQKIQPPIEVDQHGVITQWCCPHSRIQPNHQRPAGGLYHALSHRTPIGREHSNRAKDVLLPKALMPMNQPLTSARARFPHV